MKRDINSMIRLYSGIYDFTRTEFDPMSGKLTLFLTNGGHIVNYIVLGEIPEK